MRIGAAFVLGVAAGVVVGWLWGREMEEALREGAREVRAKAAEGVRAVGETAEKMLERGGEALRRAGGLVHDTEEHVSAVLGAAPGTRPTADDA